MGVDTASVMAQQGLTAHDENKAETGREVEVDLTERKISWRSGWRSCSPIERVNSPGWTRWEAKTDLAKAVKSDDAEVPVDLWDQAVCRAPPSEVEKKALTSLRDFVLLRYRRRLWLDARKYLQVTHGNDWSQSRHAKVLEDVTAIHDILWRAASNNWFEYPLGSRLIFFLFPARYCTEAKRGVKVFFTSKGPSSRRRRQPPLKPDEKTILRKKLLMFINKGYLAPHIG